MTKRNDTEITFSILYKLMLDTMAIVNHKTFIDENWVYMWERFYVLSNFFKNCCENKCIKFKLALKEFTPRVYSFPRCNPRDFKLVFDWYVRMESFHNLSNLWKNQDKELVISDRPELFLNMMRYFECLTEFINGPCLPNQELLHRYRIDMWMGIITRVVDDIDSPFFEVKNWCLTYIHSFTEGLNEKLLQFMSQNVPAGKIMEHVNLLIKKLYVRFKLSNSSEIDYVISNLNKGSNKIKRQPSSSINKVFSMSDIETT